MQATIIDQQKNLVLVLQNKEEKKMKRFNISNRSIDSITNAVHAAYQLSVTYLK